MNTRPNIAVIIPVYNREKYVLEALQSIDRQTRLPDEIVIVDDGSSDKSVELVKSWTPERAPVPKVIEQENQGAAAARNLAIQNTNADLIAMLDSDDVFLPEHLELLESAFRKKPSIVACSGNSGRLDDMDQFKKTGFDEGVFQNIDFEKMGELRVVGAPYKMMLGGAFIPTCSSMFSRRAAVECGMFDATLRTCEDTDFWLRMTKQGPFGFYLRQISLVRKHDDNLTHRRNIVSQIIHHIIGIEKLIQTADTLALTDDELEATRQMLATRVTSSVNRASRYGLKSYLSVCQELARRGYWRRLIQLKPMLRALVRPLGESSKMQRSA